jgi:hypothetical protein
MDRDLLETLRRHHTASIGRTVSYTPKQDKRAESKSIAFDWMRSVLQNQIAMNALRHQLGELPELRELLRCLYEGRLTERNRSMVILANRRGLTCSVTCSFLGIDRHTYRKYLRTFENAGVSALFALQTKSNRKFDNETIKNALFVLLHEPPSNYGINRTTWTMGHLSRILRETGHPVGPERDPKDHKIGRIPVAQSTYGVDLERPGLLRET